MKSIELAAFLGGLVLCSAAAASTELAQAKQCMQCHKVKEAFAGPSFHEIAQARKGQRDAMTKMVVTIRRGSNATGGPHWGAATMPDMKERPEVSQAEARTLAKWILKQ
ncbi:c-type cytochrome [Ramlibacter sp. WS9]|uniref:c-type cytochrome n=1 Tax=Ramlibacter sp. WS9 TaxID=1882741 RepID=UPI0011442085|nr:c-type cytochrome [Ramlibacter sp. WS9]ROZ75705.1 cytochrome C [Ramlibacter sp. WS9]